MKRWLAGVITIGTTFIVTVVFVYVVSLALAQAEDSIRLPLLIVAAVIGLLGAIGFIVVAFSLYGLINGREPLGLPEGSVRALIALLILVIFAAMTIFFFGAMRAKATGSDAAIAAASELAKQVLTVLGTLLTAISSFYFGSQSATSAAKLPAAGSSPAPLAGGGSALPPPASSEGAGTPNLSTGTAVAPTEKHGMEQAD